MLLSICLASGWIVFPPFMFGFREFLRQLWTVKPLANGRNIVGQQLPTLLDVTCCVRLYTCCMLLRVVAQSLKLVKLLATHKLTQQLQTMLGVVGQQCCIRLHTALCANWLFVIQLTRAVTNMKHVRLQRVVKCWNYAKRGKTHTSKAVTIQLSYFWLAASWSCHSQRVTKEHRENKPMTTRMKSIKPVLIQVQ